MAYASNYKAITHPKCEEIGLLHIGVQILTIESITIKLLVEDEVGVCFIEALETVLKNTVAKPEDRTGLVKNYLIAADFKYMAKESILPRIVRETKFVDRLIKAMKIL